MILANGTRIDTGIDWCRTTLPNGKEVPAEPNAESPAMAERLGYGGDVAQMTREHDALHAIVTDAIGLPFSISLMLVAGEDVPAELAALEEDAILKLQELRQRWRTR